MGMTIAEKIIARAAGVDQVRAGDIHTVTLDRMMSNDGTTHLTVDMYPVSYTHLDVYKRQVLMFCLVFKRVVGNPHERKEAAA